MTIVPGSRRMMQEYFMQHIGLDKSALVNTLVILVLLRRRALRVNFGCGMLAGQRD